VLHALLVLLLLAIGSSALAAQRALLVGVSELVNQPPSLWLQAPRNDVLLMRQALQQQGFAPGDIAVVADGVSGAALPDAQAIHEALGRLLAQSASGDFVLLYFSGHGTRLRDPTKRYQEPDGLAENFLARDVRGAIGSDAPLAGGLRDVDVDGWIRAFLARNVFVWAVFDTCSAASMTRSGAAVMEAAGDPDDEVRFRGLRAEQIVQGEGAAALPAAPPAAENVPRARYVAFFASESHQVTPELRLPRGERGARPQGLLTWAVAQSLQRRPATWRALFDGVLALYPPVIEELETRFPQRELPSPVAEGNLDAPLFANSAAPQSTQPVWRAQRSGASLTVQAGQLDGLMPGQPLRVQAVLEDGTQRSAQAAASQVDLGAARLPVPEALRDLSGAALWSASPLAAPPAVALRVQAAQALPAGLSLDYPAAVQRAGEGHADVRWTPLGNGSHRVERQAPELGAPGAAVLSDTAALRRHLQALAQLKWFAQLHALGQGGRLDGFDASIEIWQDERPVRSAPAQQAEHLAPPGPQERAVLNVRNTSGQSLDLAIVGVDAQGGIQPVFPAELGETNRFERGSAEAPAAKRFALPWFDAAGGARLLVLATPAAPHSAPRLFGTAAAAPVADVRVRGQLRPESERQVFAAMVRWAGASPPVR